MRARFPIIGPDSAFVTPGAALSVESFSALLVYDRGVKNSRIAIRTNPDGKRLPVSFHPWASLSGPILCFLFCEGDYDIATVPYGVQTPRE